jgi:asparagine synthase (glutamine-hydrolysing)
LARDRLGVKPLFYALLPEGVLIFASELKALLEHPGLPRALDPRRVEDFFAFGYVPDPGTILRSVCKLEPGHLLSVIRGRTVPVPRRYWDIAFVPRRIVSADEVADELLERFRDAVSARLVADVPLGAFLSGGIDSSAVVAMMSEATGAPVTTCSIAFHDQAFDESRHAARVAERYRTRHHVETVEADARLPLDELAALYDEPFADSSAIPTYQVSRIARRHVTVALSGDGGDESLAGYRRYPQYLAHEALRSLVPLPLRGMAKGMARALAAVAGRWSGMPGQTTLSALSSDAADGYLELISLTRTSTRRRLFDPVLTRELQGYHAREVLRRHARSSAPIDSALSGVQYLDFKTYLPGDILTKVDRASMAHGLEVRSPFLDHALVEWLAGIPPDLKLRGGEGKHLLKQALRSHLPGEILDRPKAGFAVPLSRWLRGPLRAEAWRAIESDVLGDSRLLDRSALRRLMQEHEAARRDHASLLWAVMMFEASLRHLEGVSRRAAASVSPPAA